MIKSPNRKGDIMELSMCLHFLEEGYEVFKNVGCTGPVDFIVLDRETGEVRLYDSKKANAHTAQDNTISAGTSGVTDEQKRLGVRIVTSYNGQVFEDKDRVRIYFDENGERLSK